MRHEAMHLLDARNCPQIAWYSFRALPFGSVARYVLEYRAYRAEWLFRGLRTSYIVPFRSMIPKQMIFDALYFTAGGIWAYDFFTD
jgi:hypothetical protein